MPKAPTKSFGNSSEETHIDTPIQPLKKRSDSFSTFDDKRLEEAQKGTADFKDTLESLKKSLSSSSPSSTELYSQFSLEKPDFEKVLDEKIIQLEPGLEDLKGYCEFAMNHIIELNQRIAERDIELERNRKEHSKDISYLQEDLAEANKSKKEYEQLRDNLEITVDQRAEEKAIRRDEYLKKKFADSLKYLHNTINSLEIEKEDLEQKNLELEKKNRKAICEQRALTQKIDEHEKLSNEQERGIIDLKNKNTKDLEALRKKLAEQQRELDLWKNHAKDYEKIADNHLLENQKLKPHEDLAKHFFKLAIQRREELESTKAKEDEALEERDLARYDNACLAELLETKSDEIKLLKEEKDSALQEIDALRENNSDIEEEKFKPFTLTDVLEKEIENLKERLKESESAASETYAAIDAKESAEKKLQDFFAEFSTKIANITIERDRASQDLSRLETESGEEILRLREALKKGGDEHGRIEVLQNTLRSSQEKEEDAIRAKSLAEESEKEVRLERDEALVGRDVARHNLDNMTRLKNDENEARRSAEARANAAESDRATALAAQINAEANAARIETLRANEEAAKLAAIASENAKEVERLAAIAARKLAEEREAAKEIERANEQSLKDLALTESARIQKEKEDAEMARKLALDNLAELEKESRDLRLNSEKELLEAKIRRDEDLARIEKLQKELEEKSQAPSHKIIREFEKTFKPNYSKSSELLFGDKTDEEKNIEIDYYRNHRHKIYQDDDTKLAHTKIDLSKASDKEVIREIAKDRERAVRNSLPKLVAKLIGQKNKESVIENLSRTDIVIALSVGNSEEFYQWKKDNPDANIGATFFGKLEKGSEAQKIRFKAVENLLEGIKGYAAFFGVDDSKVLKSDMRPNTSPQFATSDALSEKFKSRS